MNNAHHSFFLATKPISIMDTKKQILQEWQEKEIRFQNRDGNIKQTKKKENANEYTEHINIHRKKKYATTETKIEQVNKQQNKYQEETNNSKKSYRKALKRKEK